MWSLARPLLRYQLEIQFPRACKALWYATPLIAKQPNLGFDYLGYMKPHTPLFSGFVAHIPLEPAALTMLHPM